MANLPEQAVWQDGIYQIEETDDVRGGPLPAGVSNLQPKQLADRTRFLKEKVEAAGDSAALYDTSKARNLLNVLGIRQTSSVAPATLQELAAAMAILRQKINADGDPDFSGLRYCDYLDLPSLSDGTSSWTWANNIKNLRIMIAGFNLYKNTGIPENTKNHIVFRFMVTLFNTTMNNSYMSNGNGGWAASVMKTRFDGGLKDGLIAVLGDCLLPVRRMLSTLGEYAWCDCSVFLPTEYEIFGCVTCGEPGDTSVGLRWPIYRDSSVWVVMKKNGSTSPYWTCSPSSSTSFIYVTRYGNAEETNQNSIIGCIPAFCVA